MKNLNSKSYNAVLNETADFFKSQGISIIGEGFREISTSPALFESYVEALSEGMSADHAATMAQLMSNTNTHILHESSITGIQPVASLSMPVIRKLWPKFALKDALETEVAKAPRFVISYTKPYMFRDGADGEVQKVYLPRALRPDAEQFDKTTISKTYVKPEDVEGKVADGVVTLTGGSAVAVTFDTKVTNSPSAVKVQPCDELVVDSVTVGETAVKLGKRLDINGTGVYDVPGGQLIIKFQGAACKATFAFIGESTVSAKITVRAGVSTEYNEASWSVGFDIARQDIDIPTGQHLNAPLPIEALNDMMALYQIDGTKETVDLMTNIFAQKLDVEVIDFIRDSFVNQPSNEAFISDGYGDASGFTVTFDCKPAAGFAGSPKAWREELKPLIDHLAQRIKSATYLSAGRFNIVAHPLDVQLLANVDWAFRSGNGGNVDGVEVDYSTGTYVGANTYHVIASNNVPKGAMFIVFLPSGGTQMTYKYYPYSFSTEMGYTDPNRSRVPSIMMTKRHTFAEFMPAAGCIHIVNNDGVSYFNDYVSTKEWSTDEYPGANEGAPEDILG